MRGRDDAHVDRDRLRCAHRPHFAFLQHAQQLDLQRAAACRRSRRGRSCRRRRPGTSPLCACTAPVNAPRAWPNSSDSSSGSGIAPQLTPTNGLSRRGLARWMARASSSLPVPESPKISTLASESATSRACRSRSSMRRAARDDARAPFAGRLLRRLAMRRRATATAAATFCSSSWLSNGLVRNPKTPRCVAATASGIVPCAVRMITGSAGCWRWIASNSCRPSMPGIRRSVITAPGRATASAASAVSPLSAVRTR